MVLTLYANRSRDEELPEYEMGHGFEPEADQELEDLNVDIDFAPVNDLQGNLDERSMSTTNASTSAVEHKWHPHTVKVMKVLRKSMEDKVRLQLT